jgi:uracil-DNA glycosylase
MASLIEKLGKWYDFFDKEDFNYLLDRLRMEYKGYVNILPDSHVIFKAFELCNPDECDVVMLGQDPYFQKGVSTGIAFGNKAGTLKANYSPSLSKLLEPYEIDDSFDCTLESWCKQGVLMLNSSLTVMENSPNSHSFIWRYFMTRFLIEYSTYKKDIIYVLFGTKAQNFKWYIKNSANIIECNHPSYMSRSNIPMPNIYKEININLLNQGKNIIRWV